VHQKPLINLWMQTCGRLPMEGEFIITMFSFR